MSNGVDEAAPAPNGVVEEVEEVAGSDQGGVLAASTKENVPGGGTRPPKASRSRRRQLVAPPPVTQAPDAVVAALSDKEVARVAACQAQLVSCSVGLSVEQLEGLVSFLAGMAAQGKGEEDREKVVQQGVEAARRFAIAAAL